MALVADGAVTSNNDLLQPTAVKGADGKWHPALGANNGNAPGTISTVTATIADSSSLSAAVDLGAGMSLVGIESAAGWTTAVLSFQVSANNTTFVEYFTTSGIAVQTPGSLVASQRMGLDPADFLSVRYLKVRSGTSGSPVNQSGGGGGLTLLVKGL